MLIKLRARTTQPLVIIIFAEFYEDFFFFFGWFSTDKLSIRFLPERWKSRAWVPRMLVGFLCGVFFPSPNPGAEAQGVPCALLLSRLSRQLCRGTAG